jgi:hypothetical protein
MKRFSGRRQRPKEVVAKLRQAGEALSEGAQITEVENSMGVSEVILHRWRARFHAVDRDAVRLISGLTKETPGERAWRRTRNWRF